MPTQPSDMSFAASLDDGALEYSGDGDRRPVCASAQSVAAPLLVDAARPRCASIARRRATADLLTDERSASASISTATAMATAFRDDHLLPMASAIWSATAGRNAGLSAAAFVRFIDNHGLLQLRERPHGAPSTGGSRAYVERLTRVLRRPDQARCRACAAVRRKDDGVVVTDCNGRHRNASTTS